MPSLRKLIMACVSCALLALVFTGCETKASRMAMNKPVDESPYSGFDQKEEKDSERKNKKAEPVGHDLEPEKAVAMLVDQLQRKDLAYVIDAETQLRVWASKQGVAEIVVGQVRELLKSPRIEVRAPALRLTIAYGATSTNGDLIEVLTDTEYGMRKTAFDALRKRTQSDFGYSPGDSAVARMNSVDQWRKWWSEGQNQMLANKTPPVRLETPEPPQVTGPDQRENSSAQTADEVKFINPPPPPKTKKTAQD